MTAASPSMKRPALVLLLIACFSLPGRTAPTDGAPDFTRLVVLGGSFAAGEASGTLFDGQSAPSPVPLGQQE